MARNSVGFSASAHGQIGLLPEYRGKVCAAFDPTVGAVAGERVPLSATRIGDRAGTFSDEFGACARSCDLDHCRAHERWCCMSTREAFGVRPPDCNDVVVTRVQNGWSRDDPRPAVDRPRRR